MNPEPVGHARLVGRVASTLNVSGASETKGGRLQSEAYSGIAGELGTATETDSITTAETSITLRC